MCGYASRSAAASLGSALTITTGCPATTPASGTRVCCGTSVSSMNHLSRTLQASQPTSKEYSVVPGRLSAQRCAVSCSASPSILAAPLSMRARNAHFHHHRSWPQVPTSRAGRTPLGQCPIGATTRRCGGILPQSSSALTNAAGSNGARPSSPSPRPTSFTGTPSSRCPWKTMPPFAVPSSFVSTMPFTSTSSAHTRACANPSLPVVASGGIQHQLHLVLWCLLLHHTFDLAELVHQARFGVQPARRIHQHRIGLRVTGPFHRVERHRGRVGPLVAAHHFGTHTL